MNTSPESFAQYLELLHTEGRYRELKPLKGRSGCKISFKGREMLNLSSNDYLGLAGNLELHQRFYSQLEEENLLEKYGLGAASSRLLTGDYFNSHLLEDDLSGAYGKEACLLFNSGYHANIGILPALTSKKDLILSDKLNHASITDGMRLSYCSHKRYHHRDYDHLQWMLEKYKSSFERLVIVTESVFSMDGDIADLGRLAALKHDFDAYLYVDEAHAIGVYGENGLGIAEEQGLLPDIDLLVGTFGKAPASIGAFVLCRDILRNYLINTSRSLIFTTALPPVTMAWNRFIFSELSGLNEKRDELKQISGKLREDLVTHGLQTAGDTNIVPVMLGDDELAVKLAEKMQSLGYLILPVRPPTVPKGTSRFRLSLTADMTWQDLEPLAALIAKELDSYKTGK
jgi:8-amino-7-oxononanoate synthase